MSATAPGRHGRRSAGADAEAAAEHFARGEPVVLISEIQGLGVAAIPADDATAPKLNFLIKECRGLVYVGLPAERLEMLGIPPQSSSRDGAVHHHVPVDFVPGTTTGISAEDRTRTVLALLDGDVASTAFRTPGHVTPLALHPDGVLGRLALVEALSDIAWCAGRSRAVVFSSVLDEHGASAGPAELRAFAHKHGMPSVTLADVIRLRRCRDGWPEREPEVATLHLPYLSQSLVVRSFGGHTYRDRLPVVIHARCTSGQLLGLPCGCGEALRDDLARLQSAGVGALALLNTTPERAEDCPRRTPDNSRTEAFRDLVAAYLVAGTAVAL